MSRKVNSNKNDEDDGMLLEEWDLKAFPWFSDKHSVL